MNDQDKLANLLEANALEASLLRTAMSSLENAITRLANVMERRDSAGDEWKNRNEED